LGSQKTPYPKNPGDSNPDRLRGHFGALGSQWGSTWRKHGKFSIENNGLMGF